MVGGVCVYGVIVLVGMVLWGALLIQRGRERGTARLRRREMLHEERLAAIEKDLPPPESLDDAAEWVSHELEQLRARWLMRATLGFGLLSSTAGVGMLIAFYFAPDRSFRAIWTLGFIPLLAGIGVLLFWGFMAEHEES
ncbi:MAG: hypothetical protein AAF533_03915 [Acidobacteriota bacterium]